MLAIAILIGGAAEIGVARLELLAFVIEREDDAMLDRSGGEAMLDLRVERGPAPRRPVDFVVGKEVAVPRGEKRSANAAAPRRRGLTDLDPTPDGAEPVSTAIQRVGMEEGNRVEPVELAPSGRRESCGAKTNRWV